MDQEQWTKANMFITFTLFHLSWVVLIHTLALTQ